ncbi:hypothetical protein DL96DRAFT_1717646 [Flagelloscypha sp. PMI_526]|nr:hypothetical protein DL96DRAFT_1717646 [Flagelloscypha sp. PMI_526]
MTVGQLDPSEREKALIIGRGTATAGHAYERTRRKIEHRQSFVLFLLVPAQHLRNSWIINMVLSVSFVETSIRLAREYEETRVSVEQDPPISPTTTTASDGSSPSMGSGEDAPSSVTSDEHDQFTVSASEARLYYADLASSPTLLYRTGRPWTPPTGLETYPLVKSSIGVFDHPIMHVWDNVLSLELVDILDAHKIPFSTVDVIRFETREIYGIVDGEHQTRRVDMSPVTIWIGVDIEMTSAQAAHGAAKAVLALLTAHNITDIDVDFRSSTYVQEVSTQLLPPVHDKDPLAKVVGPITSALGVPISTNTRPNAQGMMTVYLTEGSEPDRLLGLTCRHVVIPRNELNTTFILNRSTRVTNVVALGDPALQTLVDSVKDEIKGHRDCIKVWKAQIDGFVKREDGLDDLDVAKAKSSRAKTEKLVAKAERAMGALLTLLNNIQRDWRPIDQRVLGPVLYAPPIRLVNDGSGPLLEDWAIFEVNRAMLGPGFRGNVLDLGVLLSTSSSQYLLERSTGTNISSEKFTARCSSKDSADWTFQYPEDRHLPLSGMLTRRQMDHPDMFDDGEPCLLVIKSGSATGTTIGRANGVHSVVRKYAYNPARRVTCLEWCILNYGRGTREVFSKQGDSGSIIVDTKGRLGGMLTGGSGITDSLDATYATPFSWLLQRINDSEFPNANLNINV